MTIATILLAAVCGVGGNVPEGYCPPMISNGDLNMLVDWWGGQGTNEYFRLTTEVFWQGRRGVARKAELFGFGRFAPSLCVDGADAGRPREWKQELDVDEAFVLCDGRFPGVDASTKVFCAIDRNVVAIRRVFRSSDGRRHTVRAGLGYDLPQHSRLTGSWAEESGGLRRFTGRTYGNKVIDFTLSVLSPDGGPIERAFTLEPGAAATNDWFVVFTDTLETEEVGDEEEDIVAKREANPPAPRADAICRELRRVGFDGLFAEHSRIWRAYNAESFVRVPDPAIQRMWRVQQYHLRCNAGRWGFPVGIFPHHWQGHYFGFDATYMHDGLVACGHFDVARKCPDWRFAVMPWAEQRQRHYFTPGTYGARWMWMSLEDGDMDVSGIGFWQDHIFAMGTIARSAWTQYLYARDRAWLSEKGYPIIRNCALFYLNNWMIEDGDGSAHIGRCTDLERLGPSKDRAFLTTCGAIYAMRAAADASAVLGTNTFEIADFRAAADRLVKGMPVSPDGTRYIAYEGCKEESVGTLGGLYPFPVFGTKDALQVNAARHFMSVGRAAGNMYPMGSKVCPWYAGKMSATMVKLGDRVEPYRWLKEASDVIGLFGETWEINEAEVRIHPWFTTASGACSFALAQMLVAEVDGVLHIAPGVPEAWRDYAFRLPTEQGVVVDCEVKGGKVVRLEMSAVSRDDVGRSIKCVVDGEMREMRASAGPAFGSTDVTVDLAAIAEIVPLALQAVEIQRKADARAAAHAAELAKRGVAEVPACGVERYTIDTGGLLEGLSFDEWGEFYVDRRFVTDEEMKVVKAIESWIRRHFPAKAPKRRVAEPGKGAASGVPVFRGFEDARYQAHDALILRLVDEFNADKAKACGGTAGQAAKISDITPALVKAHMIEESGGNGPVSKAAWAADPLQVNVPGDWGAEKELVGLSKPEKRNEGTLEGNVRAAIRYLSRKGFGASARPAAERPKGYFDGWTKALQRYNGRRDRTETDRYYSDEYADKIVRRASDPSVFVPIEIRVAAGQPSR